MTLQWSPPTHTHHLCISTQGKRFCYWKVLFTYVSTNPRWVGYYIGFLIDSLSLNLQHPSESPPLSLEDGCWEETCAPGHESQKWWGYLGNQVFRCGSIRPSNSAWLVPTSLLTGPLWRGPQFQVKPQASWRATRCPPQNRCKAAVGRGSLKIPDLCSQRVYRLPSREQENGMWEGEGECISVRKIKSGEYLERDKASWQGHLISMS